MKKNILFLALGISTSVISKLLQFYLNSKIGDIIVLFSAVFFVCSISFSVKQFNSYYENASTKNSALKTLIFTCFDVVLFQILMMLIVIKYLVGMLLIIPIIGLSYLSYIKWKEILNNN